MDLTQTEVLETGPTIPGSPDTYPSRIILHRFGDHIMTHLRVEPDGRDARGTKAYTVRGDYFANTPEGETAARESFAERVRRMA